uniref:CTP_transf_like domain-containing protein n=1 Tax=Strongyloides papillosus TaxID=174720 RepID=A0A0N5C9R3_STREA
MNYDGTKIVLVSSDVCNPPTYLHLRMFECAKKYVNICMNKQVTEGILHVNNFFPLTTEKDDCISNDQRFRLTKLCCKRSKWIKADNWKINDCDNVLSYFMTLSLHYQEYYDNEFGRNIVKIIFICENNIFPSLKISENNIYLEKFLNKFNIIVISIIQLQNSFENMLTTNFLEKYKNNLHFVKDFFNIQFSTSQQLREALKKNETIRYCTENDVVDYIEKYMLYKKIPKSLKNESQVYNNIPQECDKRCFCNNKKLDSDKFLDCNKMLESYPNNNTTSTTFQNDNEEIWTSLLKSDYKKSKSLENIFRTGEHTPTYDNLTMEEMLKVNDHWVSEMLKQADELEVNVNKKKKQSFSRKILFSGDKNTNKCIEVKCSNDKQNFVLNIHKNRLNNKNSDINDVEAFLSMYDSLNLSTKAKLSNIQPNCSERKNSKNTTFDDDPGPEISLNNTISNKNDSSSEKNFALESTV